MIAYAPAVQNKLRELVVDTAEKHKIPFQRHATSRATGTDRMHLLTAMAV